MRTPIPDAISAEVLFQHDRTCCVCNEPGKAIQIHHIDENPANHDPNNLAVLCLQHHEETQIRGGFGRKLRDVDIRRHREDWLRRIAERRTAADRIVLERMTALPDHLDDEHWARPSDEALAATLATLPDLYADICRRADPFLSSTTRQDMLHGAQMIIDVLAQSWTRLASWFPPRHFGNMRADEYITKYVADRYAWNLALWEPDEPGSGGREAAIYATGDTLLDMERVVVDSVQRLGLWLDDFDFAAWSARWDKVSKRNAAG